MRALIEKLSGREIAMIVTSVGGIILAVFLAWINWQQSGSSSKAMTELTVAVNRVADTQIQQIQSSQQQILALQSVEQTNKQLIGFLQTIFPRR